MKKALTDMLHRVPPRFRSALLAAGVMFAVIWACSEVVQGDIYKYVDENGVMHFTNVPTASAGKYRIFIRERPLPPDNRTSSESYDGLILQAAETNGIAVPLLKALIKAESNFNPRAVSHKGALGLMQIMPQNLEALNIRDPFDPKENIMGGARYFRNLVKRFEGEVHLAIAAYNAGPETVERHRGIPPIKETEDFVRRVLEYYRSYRQG